MTLDLSKSTDPEINSAATVLRELDAVASRSGVEFLVVGATARNMLAHSITGATPERATHDVDIAVGVADWDEVWRLGSMFGARGLHSHLIAIGGIPVDIIPCGAIERADRTVTWPGDFTMNTLGFREAFGSAEMVLLPDQLMVRIPSIAAQVLLKLVAWYDRHWTSTKDAVDLRTMLEWSDTAQLLEELYVSHFDLVEMYDYDTALAGAHRIGNAIAALLDLSELAQVRALVQDPQLQVRLAGDMRGVFDRSHQRLIAMISGVLGEHEQRFVE
ncbi:hypothetical protein ACFWF3_02990 [Nocardia sp. NPDC060220]|uniref:hypothetical protein n=1 Tax=Nocardia sp. NPDC060220 TaxID=3347076 RepID=UPI0036591E0C